MNKFITYLFVLSLTAVQTFAQYNGNDFAISANASLNTNGKIFLTPNAPNILDQNNFFEIEDIYSYSIEIRYRLYESLILGLSAEYMQAADKGRTLPSKQFIVEDGYKLYPIEISAYYFLPFSTEDFKFYMGGGVGVYTGTRTRNFGNIHFNSVDSEVAYGIQVSVGMDYIIFDFLSARGELRFRDPDFKVTNRYSSDKVIYEDREYMVSQENITSKINVDGITLRLGLTYHFNL